ncbi:MAG: hypothetical protein OXG09_06225 [Chloroflexi bacterium]|nr:hypothetical protein [Chloroflexota bacterium]
MSTPIIIQQERAADLWLPRWARRSHPVVRRQLGLNWRTLAPEYTTILRVYLFQVALIAATYPIPFLFNIVVPLNIAFILFLPLALVAYGYCLYRIAAVASYQMAREVQQESVELLKMLPMPNREMLLAQAAAAMWKRVDLISTLLMLGVFFSLPGVMAQYANLWSPYEYAMVSRLAMALGLASMLLRLVLEPFMVSVIGVVMGVALPHRAASVLWALGITGMYFLILNLVRQLPLNGVARFGVEIALPLVAPLVVMALLLQLALYLLRPD